MQSVLDAEDTGDFGPCLDYAIEEHRQDTSPMSPNLAPQEFWRSTNTFRQVIYKAGKRLGPSAASYLDRVPDGALRLLAAIELEAALTGLPVFRGVIRGSWPPPERQGSFLSPIDRW